MIIAEEVLTMRINIMPGKFRNYIIKIKEAFIKKDPVIDIVTDNSPDCIMQSGVIPYIIEKDNIKIILITSRSGKKWILPKGFIDEGLTPSESAIKEAFEEAGVTGTVSETPAGFYNYTRQMKDYRVLLFPMKTENVNNKWPESSERERIIISLKSLKDYINDSGIISIIENYFSSDSFKK